MNLILKSEVRKIGDLAIHKYLVRTKLLPVMHYGCELWGLRESEELERMQRNYFKRVFRVHKSNHSVVLEGDLGLSRLIRMVKFWIKILRSKSKLAKEAYFCFLEDKIEVAWPQGIKKIIVEVEYCAFLE